MFPVLVSIFAVVGVLSVTLLSSSARQLEKSTDEAWAAAARALGGVFVPGAGGILPKTSRKIIAEVSGREVTIHHHWLGGASDGNTFTRIRCRAAGPESLKLRVTPAGSFGGLARAVGFEDIRVGDEAFDAEYIVKASDAAIAPLWLNAAVRAHIVAVPDFRFKLERGRVEAECAYVVDAAESIVAAAEAAVRFADGKQRLLKSWKKLAREHGGRVEPVEGGWARVELEIDGLPVEVTTRDRSGKHVTAITVEARDRSLPEIIVTHNPHLHEARLPLAPELSFVPSGYHVYTHAPGRYASFFDAPVAELIERLAPEKVMTEPDRVSVVLDGVETNRKALKRAIELARRIAAHAASSPYR